MKIHKFTLPPKNTYIQVYLTKQEYEDENIINEINKYKDENYKIAYFMCGPKNYPEILKNIIFFEVGKNNVL